MSIFDRVGIKLVRGLSYPINTSAVVIMAFYTMLWGFWVGNPFWDVFTKAALYSDMAAAAAESVWGIVAFVSGLVMLYGVLRPSYESLARGAFTGAVHWLVVGCFYLFGDWHNTGGITALMVSIYCTFVYLNLRVNRDIMQFER